MKFRDLSACSTDILEAIEHLDEYGSEEEYDIIMSLCELRKKSIKYAYKRTIKTRYAKFKKY